MKKLLKKIKLSSLIKVVPVIGDVVENVKSLDGGEGKVDPGKLAIQIIRLLILLGAIYLVITGKMSVEDLSNYQ